MRTARFLTLLMLAWLFAGCRQEAPPPSHDRDLGDGGSVVLLPVAPPWTNPALKDGKADWYSFTPPGEETEPEEEPADDQEVLVAEIRDLVGEFNELFTDGTVDDLIEYFTDDQQDAIKPHLESGLTLGRAIRELQTALEDKLPDQQDRITAGCKALASDVFGALIVSQIITESDTELTGRVTLYGAPVVCRFVLEDDTWFLSFPDLPDFAAVKSDLDETRRACDAWLSKVRSDDAAESVLAEIEQAAGSAERERPPDQEGEEMDSDDG